MRVSLSVAQLFVSMALSAPIERRGLSSMKQALLELIPGTSEYNQLRSGTPVNLPGPSRITSTVDDTSRLIKPRVFRASLQIQIDGVHSSLSQHPAFEAMLRRDLANAGLMPGISNDNLMILWHKLRGSLMMPSKRS